MVTWPHEIHRKRWPRWNFLGVKLRWITQFTPIIPMVKLPEEKEFFHNHSAQTDRVFPPGLLWIPMIPIWLLWLWHGPTKLADSQGLKFGFGFAPPRNILKPRFVGWFWWIVVAVDNYGVVVSLGFCLFIVTVTVDSNLSFVKKLYNANAPWPRNRTHSATKYQLELAEVGLMI